MNDTTISLNPNGHHVTYFYEQKACNGCLISDVTDRNPHLFVRPLYGIINFI